MTRNVIGIAGIESVRDKNDNVKYYSVTFMNNLYTWQKNHPDDILHIIDARKFLKSKTPITDLWAEVRTAFGSGGIDCLVYSGHATDEHLWLYTHVVKDLPHEERCIGWDFDFTAPFNPSAEIWLMGCQTGGHDGKKWTNSIAQVIADKVDRKVWAFVSKCAQKKIKGGYYQVPDTGGYVEFVKQHVTV